MRHTIIAALQAPATLNSANTNHDKKKRRLLQRDQYATAETWVIGKMNVHSGNR